jgi:hypothetical protein
MAKATFARVRDFVPPALRYSYLQTHVVVDVGERLMPVHELVELVETPVFVVTGENPMSQRRNDVDNQELTNSLRHDLEEAGYDHWPAVGSDPHSEWSEASFAIVGPRRADVRRLGRRFNQFAYFEVTHSELIVRGVYSSWSLGRRHGVEPLPANECRLSDAVVDATGLEISDSLRRFRYHGWHRVSDSEEICAACEVCADLYALVHRQKSGYIVEHLALSCPTCGWVKAATQLGRDRQRALELWYDHQIALADTGRRRDQRKRRCYVIDLDTPAGPAVYVGETGKTVEERFREHCTGYKASPDVEQYGIGLNRELTDGLPEFPDEMSSRTYEAYLGKRLALDGYTVRGAH